MFTVNQTINCQRINDLSDKFDRIKTPTPYLIVHLAQQKMRIFEISFVHCLPTLTSHMTQTVSIISCQPQIEHFR